MLTATVTDRAPLAVGDIQVNYCRNPQCEIPADTAAVRQGRALVSAAAHPDRYKLAGPTGCEPTRMFAGYSDADASIVYQK